jgi:ADP-ribose pyrophosphatase YjhB (NUDIX family)
MKEFKRNLKVKGLFPPLARSSEVLLVVMLPNKKILLHTKDIYPKGVYRLLTGGIRKKENLEKALIRELEEETNAKILSKKLLAKLVCNVEHPRGKKIYTTYIFLVKSKFGNIKNLGSKEHTTDLKEIKISQLSSVIKKLQNLKNGPKIKSYYVENWGDWGRFRAIAHQIVYNLLKGKQERLGRRGT